MNSALAINWEQLSLVIGDDENPADDEMKDLFRLFVSDAGTRLRTLNDGARPLDRTVVAKETHKIRGAASSFGFDQVSNLLRTIEAQAQELTPGSLDEMLRDAQSTFEACVREVQERHPNLS
jgi:HPt (histidine-containing phosphotransfer) domain-containing protein